MAQVRSKRITHSRGSGALCFNAEDPILRIAMSVEQAHQRLGIAEGVFHELQEQIATSVGRASSSPRSTAIDPSSCGSYCRAHLICRADV